MNVDEQFKMFGLISIMLSWISIGYILLTIDRDLSRSISHHAALKKKNYMIFCILMLLSLIAMCLFMFKWFIPTFHLPIFFSGVIILAIISEAVATVIPLTSGWRLTVHNLASYGSALLFPVLLLTIVLSSAISKASLYVTLGSMVLLFILWFLFVFVKKTRARYLVYQSIYIIAFHIPLIVTTYF